MALYEQIYLVRQDVTPQQVETLTKQYNNLIISQGGEITATEYLGLKPLAYRIKKNRKAYMVFNRLVALPEAIAALEWQMKINEDVLRYFTIRVKEHEEGPSLMMRKRDIGEREDMRPPSVGGLGRSFDRSSSRTQGDM